MMSKIQKNSIGMGRTLHITTPFSKNLYGVRKISDRAPWPPGGNLGNREDHRHTNCPVSLRYEQGQSPPVKDRNTGTDLKRITPTTTNKPSLKYYTTNTNRLHPNQQQITEQPKMMTELMPKNMQNYGVWKRHMQWNANMLQQKHFQKTSLKKLQAATLCSFDADLFSSLQLSHWIYAMVHLPTNSIYVQIATKPLYIAVKQHWYGRHHRESRFHKLLGGNIRNLMIWPLEKITEETNKVERKQFWIRTLLGLKQPKKWTRKHPKNISPTTMNLSPCKGKNEASSISKQMAIHGNQPTNKMEETLQTQEPSLRESDKLSLHKLSSDSKRSANLDEPFMTEKSSETHTPERNCTNFSPTSTPITVHSAQEKSELSPIIKQLATCNKLSSVKQLSLFETPNAEMVLNSDSENTQTTKNHIEVLDYKTQPLEKQKLTPGFSSDSLLSFLYEFATEQEISTVLQGTSYEKAFNEQDREKIKSSKNKVEQQELHTQSEKAQEKDWKQKKI